MFSTFDNLHSLQVWNTYSSMSSVITANIVRASLFRIYFVFWYWILSSSSLIFSTVIVFNYCWTIFFLNTYFLTKEFRWIHFINFINSLSPIYDELLKAICGSSYLLGIYHDDLAYRVCANIFWSSKAWLCFESKSSV